MRGARSRQPAELFPGRKAIVLHVWSPVAVIAAAYGGMVALPAYDDDELQKAALEDRRGGRSLAAEAASTRSPESAEMHATRALARDPRRRRRSTTRPSIVLGARGLSTFKSFVLGSVSHGVAQHAHRPVLVVPPAVRGTRRGAAGSDRCS